jgi:hypothetical protein
MDSRVGETRRSIAAASAAAKCDVTLAVLDAQSTTARKWSVASSLPETDPPPYSATLPY